MKDTVLILTNSHESTVRLVTSLFIERGQRFVRIDTDRLFGKRLDLRYDGGALTGSIVFGRRLDLTRVKSVWYRRPSSPLLPESIAPRYKDFIYGEYRSLLWSLYTTLDGFWMNPPLQVELLGHNKLKQMTDAATTGLRTPATIITNRPAALIEFCRDFDGRVAIKVLRPSLMPATERGRRSLVYTSKVDLDQLIDRKREIEIAPVLAQEYIDKALEFRVTIVGDRIFACAIHSQDSEMTKHDWRRYDIENVRHEPYELPTEIKEKLLALMAKWGLSYGAIDMILTPEGEYVFLEINPTGQWSWIEALTGLPISRAIAETLANPSE